MRCHPNVECLVKNNRGLAICLLRLTDLRNPLYPRSERQLFLIMVKSYNALLRMLLVCIFNYLKSILKYKLFILGTHHLDT